MTRFLRCAIAVLALTAVTAAPAASAGREKLSDFSAAEQQAIIRYVQKIRTKIISYELIKAPKLNSGLVVVRFTVSPTGKLQKLSVIQSSGEKNKDMLEMKWVWTAAPFPPPPKIADFDRTFSLPIVFP